MVLSSQAIDDIYKYRLPTAAVPGVNGSAVMGPPVTMPSALGGIGSVNSTTNMPRSVMPEPSQPAANDSDIATRIAQITSTDSPLMRQAATQGLKLANRRGLVNSSMGVGSAYNATIGAAGAIASQESQERTARDTNVANIAAREREAQLQAFTTLDANYQSALASSNSAKGMKGAQRAALQASLRDRLAYSTKWMQQLYGVGPPVVSTAPPPEPAPAPPPVSTKRRR